VDLIKIRNELNIGKSIFDLPLKVTFYARVSTDRDEQLNSLENQVSYYKDFIQKNSNWTYVDGYVDEGISGSSTLRRDAFLKMIKDAQKHEFDLILTKEISRFSRSTLDSIKYTQDLLSYGVGVLFQSDNINTILPDSELRLTIMASVAQEEVRKLSERVRFGLKRSVEKNVVLGNNNIWGYKKDSGKLVIVEEQAKMIVELFNIYCEGKLGLKRIAGVLHEKGYVNSKGERFSQGVLAELIRNPKYKGYYCTNRMLSVDYRNTKQKRVPREEWIVFECKDRIPPIVSEEIWEKANQLLQSRGDSFRDRQQDKTIFQNRYPFSGRMFCKEHNSPFTRIAGEKRVNNPVWGCRTYRTKGIEACESPLLAESELRQILKDVLAKVIADKDRIQKKLFNEYKKAINMIDFKGDIEKLNRKIALLCEKKEKLLDFSIDGHLSGVEFANRNNDLNTQIEALEREIAEKNSNREKLNEFKLNGEQIYNAIDSNLSLENDIDEMIKLILDRIIISKIDGDRRRIMLEIFLKFGAPIALELDLTPASRRQSQEVLNSNKKYILCTSDKSYDNATRYGSNRRRENHA